MENERNAITEIGMSPKAPREHQVIIRNLAKQIDDEIIENDFDDELEVLTEWVIIPSNLNSQSPDVAIYKKALKGANFKTVVAIEITTKREFKATKEKVIEYFELADKLKEAFVYDYETDRWAKFERKGEVTKNPSFLNLLEIDLADFIK